MAETVSLRGLPAIASFSDEYFFYTYGAALHYDPCQKTVMA